MVKVKLSWKKFSIFLIILIATMSTPLKAEEQDLEVEIERLTEQLEEAQRRKEEKASSAQNKATLPQEHAALESLMQHVQELTRTVEENKKEIAELKAKHAHDIASPPPTPLSAEETATAKASQNAPSMPAGNAQSQYDQAISLYNKGQFSESEKAFVYFLEAYASDPLVENARFWLAYSYFQQKKYDEARKGFQAILDSKPKPSRAVDCLIGLSGVFENMGRPHNPCPPLLRIKAEYKILTQEQKEMLNSAIRRNNCKILTN